MATLTEEQLKLVIENISIDDKIQFDSYSYDKVGRLIGYYNNENYSIDNDAIQIDVAIDVVKPESLTGRVHIEILDMWLGAEEFNLTDFKQQQTIKAEIQKQLELNLYI